MAKVNHKNELCKVPKLRFREFEGEWRIRKSINLFKNRRDKGNDTLPIFSVTQNKGLIPRNSLDRKMNNDAESEKNLYVAPNDIAYNMMRMWQGAVGVASQECMVSPAYIVLKPTEDVCSVFFIEFYKKNRSLYLFTSYSYGLTSDRLRLYYKGFAAIKFATPSLPEQKKIASFLSAVDKNIQQLTRKKELLEQYKKGVMQKIFSREIRFKDENGKDYPVWKEKELGLFLKEYTERVPASTKLPILTSSRKGLFAQSAYFNDRELLNDGEYGVVPRGYFTYRHMSDDSTFKFNINQICEKGAVSKEYPVFTTHGMDSYFLYIILNFGIEFKKFAIMQKRGGTRTRLYFKVLKGLILNLPTIHEQNKIASFLKTVDNKIEKTTNQLAKTQKFKKGLLQQMFI